MGVSATSTTLETRAQPGSLVTDLDTPTILADLDRMERNIRDWQQWMDDHGVKFRVHIKTHKVPDIALMQMAAGSRGIICAKISEAERKLVHSSQRRAGSRMNHHRRPFRITRRRRC